MNKAPKLRFREFDGEWRKEIAGELCDFIVPGRNKPKKFDGTIPWITTPDITHNARISSSKSGLAISLEEAKSVGSKIVPRNAVVISCVGELGLVALAGNELVINQQLHAFIAKERIDYRFLMYAISTQEKYMDRVATKTAVPYMNKDNCNSIPVFHSFLPEQQKIAAFLSAVDKKIQQLTRKKELLEQYKKGVMQKLFSQEIRFKDENGNDYPEWEEKRLRDVLTIGSGRDYKHLQDGEIPVFGTGGYMLSVNEVLYSGESVFIGRKGTIDKPFYFDGDFWTVDTLFYTHKFKNAIPKFIYVIFQQVNWKLYNEASGVPSLSKSTIDKIKFKFPIVEEQQKIADFLTKLDDRIGGIDQQIEKTQIFKKGLLQQMFI
ncbi:restriction endonuclease subunit S [Bacteroidales bacterium AH-315-I05]|nr:restriction endonuclease subunit S [Bacteroidales bacterium AH-315-I05]